MPISGSQKSLQFALAGPTRGGAFRGGCLPPQLYVSVGGVHRAYGQSGTSYRVKDLTIDDILNEVPTTCRFTAVGFTPTVGMDVIITLGSKNTLTREFGGQILNVEQTYLGDNTANQAWNVTAIDYTWGLNKRKVIKRYRSTTVAVIAADLIANYASGYTVKVDATFGATAIDEFTVTNDDLPNVLSRLVNRGGGYWVCDYFKVVRLFTSDTSSTAPTQLTAAHPTMRDLQVTRDLSQMITRVYFEGMGSTSSTDVGVGQTTMKLVDLSPFQVGGGIVVSGPQRITYTTFGYGDEATAPWTPRTAASTASWSDVTWADTLALFVAVGSSVIMTSPDALVWTSRTTPGANLWEAVAYAPSLGIFAAVASTGTNRAMTSQDGITWTAQNGLVGAVDVAWSPSLSLFCAVGGGGIVMTSPDGVTWTARTAASVDGWSAVVWAPALSLFVAVATSASASSVMTSPNGIAWTLQSAFASLWNSIAWSPDLNLLVAFASGSVMTSPNGTAWTLGTLPTATGTWTDVTWSAELHLFVAVSRAGDARVATSPDGFTWTALLDPPLGAWNAVVWSAPVGRLVTVGATGGDLHVATAGYNVLSGIPSSGAGSVLYAINEGDDVNLLAQVDNVAAQTTLAGYIGGDGIQDAYVQDRRISYTEAVARSTALLVQRGQADTEIRVSTRDLNAKSGRTQSVNIAAPTSVTGTLIIQQSTLTAFPRRSDSSSVAVTAPKGYPTRTLRASSNRFTFEDLLRQGRKDT